MTSRMRLLSLLLAASSFGCAASRPPALGVTDGKLAPCPSAPHCVSSQAEGRRAVAPAKYAGTREEASQRLAGIIRQMPGAVLVTEAPDYLRAEFTSRRLRYVDDVEVYIDSRKRLVQFRSSSRKGYYDFRVNRKRIEAIRKQFLAAEAAAKP